MSWENALIGVAGIVALRLLVDRMQPKCHPKYGVHAKTIIVTGGNSGIGYELGKLEGTHELCVCLQSISKFQ